MSARGRITVDMQELYEPLQRASEALRLPMGAIVRDLVRRGLGDLEGKKVMTVVMTKPFNKVVMSIEAERKRQDAQWGGPETDDARLDDQWCELIQKQMTEMNTDDVWEVPRRERYVKIAALAAAAIESEDRFAARREAVEAQKVEAAKPAGRIETLKRDPLLGLIPEDETL